MAGNNNPYFIEPSNPLAALMMGVQGYDRAQKSVKDAQMEEARKLAGQTILSGGDSRSALARLIAGGDIAGANVLAQYQNNINSVYGTPIYGTGPKGETQLGTFDKSGAFKKIDTGDFTPTPGIRTIDTGTGTLIVDQRSGRPIGPAAGAPGGPYQPPPQAPGAPQAAGFVPNDVQGVAQQKAVGADVGEKQANLGKAQAALWASIANIDRMQNFAERVSKGNVEGITGWQGYFPNFRGSAASNTQANLDTLKSQVSFGVLQAMREASKTGGALGNVSDQEGQRLENNLAALAQAQDATQFRKAMRDIHAWGEETKLRLKAAYDQDFAGLPPRGQQMPPARPAPQSVPAAQTHQQRQPALSIPDGAVAALKADPRLREQFDQKYGAGASAAVLGR